VALVIGEWARRVERGAAWSHVAWVTAGNDFAVYDLRYADRGGNVRSKGNRRADAAGAQAMRFRSDPSTLRGSIAPVVTRSLDDGQLDSEGLRRLITWQLDSGSHGISLGARPANRARRRRRSGSPRWPRPPGSRGPGAVPARHGSARLDETLELTAAAASLARTPPW